MKKVILLALCMIGALVAQGCVAHRYAEEANDYGNLTFGAVKSAIKKGETNQAEILQTFRAPNLVTKNKHNNEVWSYHRMSVQRKSGSSHAGAFFFLGGAEGSRESSRVSSQSFDLIISFDENDIVKDYSVISTNY